jgi:hypothetical protein
MKENFVHQAGDQARLYTTMYGQPIIKTQNHFRFKRYLLHNWYIFNGESILVPFAKHV